MDRSVQPYRPAVGFERVLADVRRLGNPLDCLTAETAPALWLQREMLSRKMVSRIAVGEIQDTFVCGRNHAIPIRLYAPVGRTLVQQVRLPVILYYHGGGWTLGSIAAYDSLCRFFANHVSAIVISVDYRLAPEHPYPAALVDARLALEWTIRNADRFAFDLDRVMLAGDSAGATLATVIARKARKDGIAIAAESLFYPSVDIGHAEYPSYAQYDTGFWLTRKAAEAFRRFYLPDPKDWSDPDACPLLAPGDDLSMLPPTLVLACGCDVLRDEAMEYARRLRKLGVRVVDRLEETMIHACLGFYNNGVYPEASACVEPLLDSLADQMRLMLGDR